MLCVDATFPEVKQECATITMVKQECATITMVKHECETVTMVKQEYDTFLQSKEEHETFPTVKQEYETFPTVKQEYETFPTSTEEHDTFPRIFMYGSCSEGPNTFTNVEASNINKRTRTYSTRVVQSSKPTTRTIAIQCALRSAKKAKRTVRNCSVQCNRNLEERNRTLGQCNVRRRRTVRKSVRVQCAIRESPLPFHGPVPESVSSIAVQCGIAVGLPAPGIGDEFAEVKVVMELTINDVLRSVCSSVERYINLQYSFLDNHVEVTRIGWHDVPAIGFTPVKLCFYSSGKAWLLPLFKSPEETCFVKSDVVEFDIVHELLDKLTGKSSYLFCKGIDNFLSDVVKGSRQVERISYPCKRIQSKECSGYFKAATNAPYENLRLGIGKCTNCSLQQNYLKKKQKKKENVSLMRKLQRTAADSNYPISQLSPKSLRKRTANISLKMKLNR